MADIGSPILTTTQAVRSCLGLDDADVQDAIILDSGWLEDLRYALGKDLPNWQAIFDQGVLETGTANEQKFAAVLRLYAKYYFAERLSKAPMAVPWLVSDGKDQLRRNDKIDLKAIQTDMEAKAQSYWADLLQAYNVLFPIEITARRPPKLFGSSRPANDPVRGGPYEAS